MSFRISDTDLDRFLDDDAAPFDLTTELLGIAAIAGRITFSCRESALLCGTEEAARLMARCGLAKIDLTPSGTWLRPGDDFLSATGPAGALHSAWKVCLNLVDTMSGIASATARIVQAAHSVNPSTAVLTTRKYPPGTKAIVTKAAVTGGAIPHRSGLAETVLVFDNHLSFLGGPAKLAQMLPAITARACEKRVFVECDPEDAVMLASVGVAGLQLDKAPPHQLASLVPELRSIAPHIVLVAAGGINADNAAAYAATGVDGLVTSQPYSAAPVDMGARIEPTN